MSKYLGAQTLKNTLEFAGFHLMPRDDSSKYVTHWWREVQMPSGRPSARPLVILTVVESARHRGMYLFKTELTLDGTDLDPKLQLPTSQMSVEDYVLTVVPSIGTLFEVEDFYIRKDSFSNINENEEINV